ncbi:esterase E4 isoform X2 [Leptinotarsa decemlineata]|uniref:esterase E4 isoform X2 n=1 Tax=Leptinotarsa decemlineata TaxID=7539 RepID=UPI003D308348
MSFIVGANEVNACYQSVLRMQDMSKIFYVYCAISAVIFAYWLKVKVEDPTFPYFENSNPVLKIHTGQIRGHPLKTENGKSYYAFQEIPYAAPPVGELRFQEAIQPEPWSGILDTTKNTKVCYQKKPPLDDQTPDPRENEDCLYLNVFTPKLPLEETSSLLPVMVYIYGGIGQSGEPTEYNFDLFLEQDIVVVTLNFRSGALGLLTTKDGVFPANIALKDQNLALKWIQSNINYFGGDPSKVTLAGHSSGAVSVGFHVISKQSKGLLSRAILQSASPIAHLGITVDARHNAFAVGKALDPNFSFTNSSTDLLRLLEMFPAEKIMRTEIEVPPHLRGDLPYNVPANWTMTIEDPIEKNAFLTGPFHDDVKDGNINKVPILIGITDEEMIGIDLTPEMAASVDNNITCIVNSKANIKEENKLAFATELRDIYTKVPFQQNMTAFYKFNSDVIFASALIRHADLHSKHAETYFYQFSYKGHLNGLLKPLKRPPGLGRNGHCEELPYLYKYRWDPDVIPSPSDILTRKRLATLWGNFIKYANPTPSRDPVLENKIWPKVTPNELNYLDIDHNLSVRKDPRSYKAWKQRLEKYLEHPITTY